jgi:4-diphosphocytidyl-2-C-methyl-D-erythritol kinase
MNSIKISAPAKVNLSLRVLNKRKDGYHNIETLFERISLADTIAISKCPSGVTITSDKFITRAPKDNLAYKAAELILKRKNIIGGVRIHIKKNIPVAAGLGGGSSDAASVLLGINKLFKLKLKQGELAALGQRLGADVPFFLLDEPFAIGKSRGDKLEKAAIKTKLWHIIVNPGFKLPTKLIYEAYDKRCPKPLTTESEDAKIHRTFDRSFDLGSLEGILYNDLEETATAKKRVLGYIVERLAYHLGKKAIVSGRGPSVFCLCRSGKEAAAPRAKFFRSVPAKRRKGWQVFVASTLN